MCVCVCVCVQVSGFSDLVMADSESIHGMER